MSWEEFFYEQVGAFGLPAIFFLTIAEGDITLLLAGVLARGVFFGEHSFPLVLLAGTLGGVVSDQVAYALGRGARSSVREYRFYRAARPRIERLTRAFGPLSLFVSKFTYGMRWAACSFYGVAKMPYWRFLALSFASCFVWVLVLSGVGYFFHSAVTNLIGDFHQLGILLLVIVAAGVLGFYLVERYWLTEKVEQADPGTIQKLEQAAEEKLHELGQEIKEHIPPLGRRKERKRPRPGDAEGD